MTKKLAEHKEPDVNENTPSQKEEIYQGDRTSFDDHTYKRQGADEIETRIKQQTVEQQHKGGPSQAQG